MSLILDALNRSRNDAQQVPGLATSHQSGSGFDAGGLRAWLLPGALAVAVLLIIWLLWERSGDQPATAGIPQSGQPHGVAPIVPEASPAAPVPETAPAPAVDPIPAIASIAAPEPEPEPEPELAPAAASLPGPAAVVSQELPGPGDGTLPDAGATAQGSEPSSASVAALYRQQQLARQEVPTSSKVREAARPSASAVAEPAAPDARALQEQPIDVGEMLAMAEEELKNARLAEHPAPFLSALSQQTKDTIPTLLYQAHDFTGKQADSFVLINGKTLKQGGSVKGVRVEEILPDSVVLSFQGTQFRLRALNSWVNL